MDGMEITQFTYFQQAGGIDLTPISVELTYGLERIAMYLQDVRSVYDLEWGHGVTYGDIYQRNEAQWSRYNFEVADTEALFAAFAAPRGASACAASRRTWCCRPTTRCSSAATRSTCSTPAASSASPSGAPTSGGYARSRPGARGPTSS